MAGGDGDKKDGGNDEEDPEVNKIIYRYIVVIVSIYVICHNEVSLLSKILFNNLYYFVMLNKKKQVYSQVIYFIFLTCTSLLKAFDGCFFAWLNSR